MNATFNPQNRVMLIAGPSGSGKSTVARSLGEMYPQVSVVHFDDFQHDADFLKEDEQGYRNWDDPNFTDFDLALDSIKRLKSGNPISVMAKNEYDNPRYIQGDYRRKKVVINPAELCIIEGHYALLDPRIVEIADFSVYMSIDTDKSFARRTKNSDTEYDYRYLHPMHIQHVLPTKERADLVIDVDELSKEDCLNAIAKIVKDMID